MDIADINNYMRISEHLSSSGQPEDGEFKTIAGEKFKVVINLAMPNSENAIPEEGNIVTALKMSYVHIPVPFDAPGADHLNSFINVMSAFSGDKVWVHCVKNYRVSAFLYQYQRLVHNVTAEDASRVMLPSWQPDAIWQRFMAMSKQDIGL